MTQRVHKWRGSQAIGRLWAFERHFMHVLVSDAQTMRIPGEEDHDDEEEEDDDDRSGDVPVPDGRGWWKGSGGSGMAANRLQVGVRWPDFDDGLVWTGSQMSSELPQSSESTADAREREAQAIQGLANAYSRMRDEISKVIVGQAEVVDEILIAMFSRGHCLLVGVPGLAKTLLVSTIANILQLSFRRIQFTPDLMPSDITGTDVLQDDPETGRRSFQFMQGPLFTNVLLADEINRTPPKTQAALLEAMQERHVTVGSSTYRLPAPFFVLATQNPIEQEGTYPLPEAQLDRFMFNVIVKYPSAAEELLILKQTTGGQEVELGHALTGKQILALQEVVRKVPVPEHVFVYARDLVRATRPEENDAPGFIKEYISWGAGPRAGQYLILGAKARAILEGRFHVTTEDVQSVAQPVLRHRLVTTFQANSEGISTDDVVDQLIDAIPVELHERARKLKK